MSNKDINDYINFENNEKDIWTIIDSYFKDKYLEQLVRHQIESYNDFIQRQLPNTIEMFNPIHITPDNYYNKVLNKYSLEIFISFLNFSIHKPEIHENNGATKLMFPQEARLRNFTYTSNITIDLNIKIIVRTGNELENIENLNKIIPKVYIGKIPIMLKSCICVLNYYNHMSPHETGECKMDPGGYFIINGSEKTILGQERAAENIIYCFDVNKINQKWSYIAEIKSVSSFKCISPKQISVMMASKNTNYGNCIYIQIPRMKNPIPIFILFRVFNIISDKDICKYILLDIDNKNNNEYLDILKASIEEASNYNNYETCIKYITSNVIYTPINIDKEQGNLKKKKFALEVIENDLFPHCNSNKQKLYFLGYMILKLIKCSLKQIEFDDRDSYINKRIDTAGILLNNLYRNYFNKLVKDMQKQINREINNGSWKSKDDYLNIINLTNIYKIIKSTTIENGIKKALATGDFGIKQNSSNKVGVAQVLNRLTYLSSLSHLRRCNTPIDKNGKLILPRKLHNSTWGFLCPAETPEGQSIGVVKNLSYLTTITNYSNSKCLLEYILNEDIIQLDINTDFTLLYNSVKIILNGAWVANANNPLEFYNNFKIKKYKGIINIYTSIIFDHKNLEIRICNDAGRLVRPLFKVKNNKILITNDIIKKIKKDELAWDDLLFECKIEESVIEYIDCSEQNYNMIAINSNKLKNSTNNNYIYKYTFCEIHPSTIFGILASCIPFSQHNQAPRLTYQCAMGKQAMGVYATNYFNRMDKTSYLHIYGMRPLVDTRLMNLINLNSLPSGAQVIIAIATYTGYNQEDSILFNKGSIDRGLFQAMIYHTEKDEDKKINGNQEIRCKPNPNNTKSMKFGNYNKVNENGVIPEDVLVENRDVIIAKVAPIKNNRNNNTKVIKYEDLSKIYKTDEDVYVDKSYIERNGEGYNIAKIRVRSLRQPNIGDKFSSRHGQKGTIGNIIPEENMPYTEDGIRPDIIINPHAIPSRMTIGQLKETLFGKILLNLGLFGDGTSFTELDIKILCKELQSLGYESKGNEILYDGLTGKQLLTNIFIGPAFYQRLKHMVMDKQHSRSIGPMVNLTRQPAEGRSRDGGLRFGEMEKDAIVAHGASNFNKERLLYSSDKFKVFVCDKCGFIVSYNDSKNIHYCKNCDNKKEFKLIYMPYSCKLLFQELMTMNICPRIIAK